MGETGRTFLWLAFIAGVVACCAAWVLDRPDAAIWTFRGIAAFWTAATLAGLLWLLFRRDQAPDYLKRVARRYFNRGGFCFAVGASAREGVAFLDIYFQNQFERASSAVVAVRPARGFFLNRPKFEAIAVRIACEPAAFGVARVAIPVPAKLQGKRQRFDVGASVNYPEGKGRRLRFTDGVSIRRNAKFGDAFNAALTVAFLAVGGIYYDSGPSTVVLLPKDVDDDFEGDAYCDVETLWKLGDEPLTGSPTDT